MAGLNAQRLFFFYHSSVPLSQKMSSVTGGRERHCVYDRQLNTWNYIIFIPSPAAKYRMFLGVTQSCIPSSPCLQQWNSRTRQTDTLTRRRVCLNKMLNFRAKTWFKVKFSLKSWPKASGFGVTARPKDTAFVRKCNVIWTDGNICGAFKLKRPKLTAAFFFFSKQTTQVVCSHSRHLFPSSLRLWHHFYCLFPPLMENTVLSSSFFWTEQHWTTTTFCCHHIPDLRTSGKFWFAKWTSVSHENSITKKGKEAKTSSSYVGFGKSILVKTAKMSGRLFQKIQ